MEEKVNLTSDPVIDSQYDDDSWQRYAIESDVKREWDNLLADNLEDYELPLSSRPTKRNSGKLRKCFSNNFIHINDTGLRQLGFFQSDLKSQGPVVQSILSLTSLLVVKMLTVLVSTISSNSQVFLLKKY